MTPTPPEGVTPPRVHGIAERVEPDLTIRGTQDRAPMF